MPLPKDGEVQLFQVVDVDGNPARVSLIAGVYRLAVDALLVGPAGAYAQGDFDSVAANEATATAIFARAAVTALDSSQAAGSQNVPVATRAALAAQAYTLQRLLVDGVVRGDDGATYSAVAARNADADADGTAALIGLVTNDRTFVYRTAISDWVRWPADTVTAMLGEPAGNQFWARTASALFGRDTTGAAVMRSVEARDAVSSADFAAALIGLLTNSRLSAFTIEGSDWIPLIADDLAFYNGSAPSSRAGLLVNAQLLGLDTGATLMRAIEARNFDNSNDVATTLIGLLVNSRLSVADSGSLAWFLSAGSRETTNSETAFAGIVEGRESGYHSSNRGRRFIATSQTAGAELTAQAAFVATTPTLMLRQAAGATETEVIRSIRIGSGAATPAVIKVVVMLDPDDRFSAGGTAVVPQNPNEGSAAASGITSFLENPTATAADADERIIFNGQFVGGDGASLTLNFKDELILAGVGSLLIYVFDAASAAAPTIDHNEEWEEYV